MASSRIKIDTRIAGGEAHFAYHGPITEASRPHLAPLIAVKEKTCIFNFKDVQYIDSIGARTWILFLREFAEGRDVFYEECSTDIVVHMNMLSGFLHTAQVRSVQIRYLCASCGLKHMTLYDMTAIADGAPRIVPDENCQKCGLQMIVGEDIQTFFQNYRASPLLKRGAGRV